MVVTIVIAIYFRDLGSEFITNALTRQSFDDNGADVGVIDGLMVGAADGCMVGADDGSLVGS